MDEIGNSDKQLLRRIGLYDRIDDGIVIGVAVALLKTGFMKQFFDDITVLFRKHFADLRAAVFDCHGTRHLHFLAETVTVPFSDGGETETFAERRNGIPLAKTLDQLDALVRIVDQCT